MCIDRTGIRQTIFIHFPHVQPPMAKQHGGARGTGGGQGVIKCHPWEATPGMETKTAQAEISCRSLDCIARKPPCWENGNRAPDASKGHRSPRSDAPASAHVPPSSATSGEAQRVTSAICWFIESIFQPLFADVLTKHILSSDSKVVSAGKKSK